MSLIIHRCTICGHPDHWHGTDHTCCYGHCRFGRHDVRTGPSEAFTTYTPDGVTVARIEQPGTAFRAFGRGAIDLCGCPSCRALYASLAGDAA